MIKIRKVDKTLAREFEFEDIKFPKIIRDIHKIEKEKNYIAIGVFWLWKQEKKNAKGTMFLSKILAHSYMIIHNSAEENIFVDNV